MNQTSNSSSSLQKNWLLVSLLVSHLCLHFGHCEDSLDVLAIGRSVAGLLNSGFNGILKTNWESPLNHKEGQTNEHLVSEGLSTDDLFNGLSQVWNTKRNELNEMQRIPPASKEANQSQFLTNATIGHEKTPPGGLENLSLVSETDDNHWARIRAIVENMKSLFLSTYGEDSQDKLEILDMLDKMMKIGDKINSMKNIEDKFDYDLLKFLNEKWSDVRQNTLSSNPILNTALSIDGKVLFLTVARGLVRQFGHIFHKQALAHIREQDFVIETMRRSGFKVSEIYEVFELLDLPTDLLRPPQTSGDGDTSNTTDTNLSLGRSGGYGHQMVGYGSMMKKNPLLLLAGLAFATFAAYIIYRFLSSTPMAMRRENSDLSLSLTLSDMPEFVTKIYTFLENAEKLYMSPEEDEDILDEEVLVNSVNMLWRSYKVDEESGSCVRRYLCHHLQTQASSILSHGTNPDQLTLLSLAELFGEEGSGKFTDALVEEMLEGKTIDCKLSSPACKDKDFASIIKDHREIHKPTIAPKDINTHT